MTTKTTRRAVLAGVPAVAIAAVPAVASHGDDAELLALLRKAEAIDKASLQTAAEQDRLCKLAKPHYPPKFEWAKPPAEWADYYSKLTGGMFDMLADDHPLKLWRASVEELDWAGYRAWRDACDKVSAQFGIDESEAEFNDQRGDLWAIVEQIMALQARTLAGVVAKFRAHELSCADDEESLADVLASIEADIRALAGEAVAS